MSKAAGQRRARRRTSVQMERLEWHRDDRLVWPEGARASSTHDGSSPSAVVGPPSVFPQHGDLSGTWAPKTYGRDTPEWLEVDFPADVRARELWVFETNLAGAVVEVRDLTDGADTVLWSGRKRRMPDARVLIVPVDPPRTIRTVRLTVDTSGARTRPQIDTVALVRDQERGASGSKVDWRTGGPLLSLPRGMPLQLGLAFAMATVTAWVFIAPRGLVVSSVAPKNVDSAATWTDLASDVRWATMGDAAGSLAGPPDKRAWSAPTSGDRIAFVALAFDRATEASSIVLVETRPFAVVRIDDVSSWYRPVTLWRGATTRPRGGDHGAIRVDLPTPRTISRLRLVVDRELARGEIDAVGVVPWSPRPRGHHESLAPPPPELPPPPS